MAKIKGQCLCGNIQFELSGEPIFPHFCSCHTCQKWSGAPIVAWVDFKREALTFNGENPKLFRSSKNTQRGFCPECGSTICALDDGSDEVSVTIATFEDPNVIIPESQSFPDSAPSWLKVEASKS